MDSSKLASLKRNKLVIILLVLIILLISAGVFLASKLTASKTDQVIQEVDLQFDPEGPYAVLIPRRDGNALVLNLKRTASYDSIGYELAYNSEGIDRGVMGDVDTSKKKGEYEQEILFGTCSKNVCKYDKDVENGTLTLKIKKGNKSYRMNTQWHIQKPQDAKGVLTSGDNHITYQTSAPAEQLESSGFSIINDLTAVPKLPPGKQVFGKVYSLNVPLAKTLPAGIVAVELPENPPEGTVIAHFVESENGWKNLSTQAQGSKLQAQALGPGIFAVLVDSKK